MPKEVEFPSLDAVLEFPDDMPEAEMYARATEARQQLIAERFEEQKQETYKDVLEKEHPFLWQRAITGAASPEEIASFGMTAAKSALTGLGGASQFLGRASENMPPELALMPDDYGRVSPYNAALVEKIKEQRAKETPQARVARTEANRLVKLGAGVKELAEEKIPTDKALESTFLFGEVPAAGGTMLGGMAAGLVGGPAGMWGATYGMEANDAYEREMKRQVDAGEEPDPEKALNKAYGYGTLATLIEAKFGVGRVANRIKKAFGKLKPPVITDALLNKNPASVRAIAKHLIKEVGTEGVTGYGEEFTQEGLESWIVEGTPDWEQAHHAGLVGAFAQGPSGLTDAAGLAARTAREGLGRVNTAAQAAIERQRDLNMTPGQRAAQLLERDVEEAELPEKRGYKGQRITVRPSWSVEVILTDPTAPAALKVAARRAVLGLTSDEENRAILEQYDDHIRRTTRPQVGEPDYAPAPGAPDFIGPKEPVPLPGSPDFTGPMLPPPAQQPGQPGFVGPTLPRATPPAGTPGFIGPIDPNIPKITEKDITDLADAKGIKWDIEQPGSEEFVRMTKRLTGQTHLSSLKDRPEDMLRVYQAVDAMRPVTRRAAARRRELGVVPGEEAPETRLTESEEIRDSNATTIDAVRRLFRSAHLSEEEANEKLKRAWAGHVPGETKVEYTPPTVTAPVPPKKPIVQMTREEYAQFLHQNPPPEGGGRRGPTQLYHQITRRPELRGQPELKPTPEQQEEIYNRSLQIGMALNRDPDDPWIQVSIGDSKTKNPDGSRSKLYVTFNDWNVSWTPAALRQFSDLLRKSGFNGSFKTKGRAPFNADKVLNGFDDVVVHARDQASIDIATKAAQKVWGASANLSFGLDDANKLTGDHTSHSDLIALELSRALSTGTPLNLPRSTYPQPATTDATQKGKVKGGVQVQRPRVDALGVPTEAGAGDIVPAAAGEEETAEDLTRLDKDQLEDLIALRALPYDGLRAESKEKLKNLEGLARKKKATPRRDLVTEAPAPAATPSKPLLSPEQTAEYALLKKKVDNKTLTTPEWRRLLALLRTAKANANRQGLETPPIPTRSQVMPKAGAPALLPAAPEAPLPPPVKFTRANNETLIAIQQRPEFPNLSPENQKRYDDLVSKRDAAIVQAEIRAQERAAKGLPPEEPKKRRRALPGEEAAPAPAPEVTTTAAVTTKPGETEKPATIVAQRTTPVSRATHQDAVNRLNAEAFQIAQRIWQMSDRVDVLRHGDTLEQGGINVIKEILGGTEQGKLYLQYLLSRGGKKRRDGREEGYVNEDNVAPYFQRLKTLLEIVNAPVVLPTEQEVREAEEDAAKEERKLRAGQTTETTEEVKKPEPDLKQGYTLMDQIKVATGEARDDDRKKARFYTPSVFANVDSLVVIDRYDNGETDQKELRKPSTADEFGDAAVRASQEFKGKYTHTRTHLFIFNKKTGRYHLLPIYRNGKGVVVINPDPKAKEGINFNEWLFQHAADWDMPVGKGGKTVYRVVVTKGTKFLLDEKGNPRTYTEQEVENMRAAVHSVMEIDNREESPRDALKRINREINAEALAESRRVKKAAAEKAPEVEDPLETAEDRKWRKKKEAMDARRALLAERVKEAEAESELPEERKTPDLLEIGESPEDKERIRRYMAGSEMAESKWVYDVPPLEKTANNLYFSLKKLNKLKKGHIVRWMDENYNSDNFAKRMMVSSVLDVVRRELDAIGYFENNPDENKIFTTTAIAARALKKTSRRTRKVGGREFARELTDQIRRLVGEWAAEFGRGTTEQAESESAGSPAPGIRARTISGISAGLNQALDTAVTEKKLTADQAAHYRLRIRDAVTQFELNEIGTDIESAVNTRLPGSLGAIIDMPSVEWRQKKSGRFEARLTEDMMSWMQAYPDRAAVLGLKMTKNRSGVPVVRADEVPGTQTHYSLGERQSNPWSIAQVEAGIRQLMNKAQLPERLNVIDSDLGNSRIWKGRVYFTPKGPFITINARYIGSLSDIQKAIAEEGTHIAFRDPTVKAAFDEVKKFLTKEDLVEAMSAGYTAAEAPEEAAVELVRKVNATPEGRNAWQRFVKAVMDFIYRAFGIPPKQQLDPAVASIIVARALKHASGELTLTDIETKSSSGEKLNKFISTQLLARGISPTYGHPENVQRVTGEKLLNPPINEPFWPEELENPASVLGPDIMEKIRTEVKRINDLPPDVMYSLKFMDDSFWNRLANGPLVRDIRGLVGKLKNALGGDQSAAWVALNTENFRKFIEGATSSDQVKQYIDAHGPKVVVTSYGMKRDRTSKTIREFNKISHDWYDMLSDQKKAVVNNLIILETDYEGASTDEYKDLWDSLSKSDQAKARKYIKLHYAVMDEEIQLSGDNPPEPTATEHYERISAFSGITPMPSWTDTKGKKNVQRVDVWIPDEGQHPAGREPYPPRRYHMFYPDTVGWAMIQYVDGPNGERVAFINEVQSNWGQERRSNEPMTASKVKKSTVQGLPQLALLGKNDPTISIWRVVGRDPDGFDPYIVAAHTEEEALQKAREEWNRRIPDSPFLRDHSRLLIKAAIEQAKKENATHIAIADAETAMMTEWHDQARVDYEVDTGPVVHYETPTGELVLTGRQYFRDLQKHGGAKPVALKVSKPLPGTYAHFEDPTLGIIWLNVSNPSDPHNEYPAIARAIAEDMATGKTSGTVIQTEKGMRFNYDGTLQKVASELTGTQGKLVNFGWHKNAIDHVETEMGYTPAARKAAGQPETGPIPRENLYFKNPDGTPKTSITGWMYPIARAREDFTLFGKDRAIAPDEERAAVTLIKDRSGNLLAPNGQVSNLNEYLWRAVRTPSFKRWFGDWLLDPTNSSKVVDENGEPMVMYHGSPVPDMTVVQPFAPHPLKKFEYGAKGLYLSPDPLYAGGYVGVNEGALYPYFVNIRRPAGRGGNTRLYQSDYGKLRLGLPETRNVALAGDNRQLNRDEFMTLLRMFDGHLPPSLYHTGYGNRYVVKRLSSEPQYGDFWDAMPNVRKPTIMDALEYGSTIAGREILGDLDDLDNQALRQRVSSFLQGLGYDGVFDHEIGGLEIVAFQPEQLKSAVANVGTYFPMEQDTRYAAPNAPVSTEEHTIESATNVINEYLGTRTLPSRITVINDPTAPYGGYYQNGQVVVNAPLAADPIKVLMEEGLHGVWKDPALQAAWKVWVDAVTPEDIEREREKRKAGLDVDEDVLRQEAAISRLLENRPADRNLIQRLLDAIADAFKRVLGIELPSESRDKLLQAAQNFLTSSNQSLPGKRLVAQNAIVTAPGMDEYALFSLWAYHGGGTPVRPRFLTSFIGSGQGSQMFGWGLYFAENRSVGEEYRRGASGWLVDGKLVKETGRTPMSEALTQIVTTNQKRAENRTREWIEWNIRMGYPTEVKFQREVLKVLESLRGKDVKLNTGFLYYVELGVDSDVLLDLNVGLAEQPPKVKAALTRILEEIARESQMMIRFKARRILAGESPDIRDAYFVLSQHLALNTERIGDAKAASLRMLKEGIRGVRYLDQFSRQVDKRVEWMRPITGSDPVMQRLVEEMVASYFNGSGNDIADIERTVLADIAGVQRLPPDSRRRMDYFGDGSLVTGDHLIAAMLESLDHIKSGDVFLRDKTYNYVIFDENDIKILMENDVQVDTSEAVDGGGEGGKRMYAAPSVARLVFKKNSQVQELLDTPGLSDQQKETIRSIARTQAGLIDNDTIIRIAEMGQSDDKAENIAADELKFLSTYWQVGGEQPWQAGLEDPARARISGQLPENQDLASHSVIHMDKDIKNHQGQTAGRKVNASEQLELAVKSLDQVDAKNIEAEFSKALADELVRRMEEQLRILSSPEVVMLTAERKGILNEMLRELHDESFGSRSAIGTAMIHIAKRIPEGVLSGMEAVTDTGQVIPSGDPGATPGNQSIINWVKAQTADPISIPKVVNWLTTDTTAGPAPLMAYTDLSSALRDLRAIVEDSGKAMKGVTEFKNWFFDNHPKQAERSNQVTMRQFGNKYALWKNQHKAAAQIVRTLRKNVDTWDNKFRGYSIAEDEMDKMTLSPAYQSRLKEAVVQLNASEMDTSMVDSTGKRYEGKGPLKDFAPEERFIDYTPSPEAAMLNSINATSIANAIQEWINTSPEAKRNPLSVAAWEKEKLWLEMHGMIHAAAQANYGQIGHRPFGLVSQFFVNIGFGAPKQGLKRQLGRTAQVSFNKAVNTWGIVATELENVFKHEVYGWYKMQEAIQLAAKSHPNLAIADEDIGRLYAPVLSKIFATNQSVGGSTLEVGDRMINNEHVTREDWKALQIMKRNTDEMRKVIAKNPAFQELIEGPLQIADEPARAYRSTVEAPYLLVVPRTFSSQGLTFSRRWQAVRNQEGNTADKDGNEIRDNNKRVQFLNDNPEVLNDYVFTSNIEFLQGPFFKGDELVRKAHQARIADQKVRKGVDLTFSRTSKDYGAVEEYARWLGEIRMKEHNANPDRQSDTDLVTEMVKAKSELIKQFDAYTDAIVENSKVESGVAKVQNEASPVAYFANTGKGPMTTPRGTMVAPDFFYDYQVFNKTNYSNLRGKALIPFIVRVNNELEKVIMGLRAAIEDKETYLKTITPTSGMMQGFRGRRALRKQEIATAQAGGFVAGLKELRLVLKVAENEYERLRVNLAKANTELHDSISLDIARRAESLAALPLLFTEAATINNSLSALFGGALLDTMAGQMAWWKRYPLEVGKLPLRIIKSTMTWIGNAKWAQDLFNKYPGLFHRFSKLIADWTMQEANLAGLTNKAGIGTALNIREHILAIKRDPATYGDVEDRELNSLQRAANHAMALLSGAKFPESLKKHLPAGMRDLVVPGLEGARNWSQFVDNYNIRQVVARAMANLNALQKSMYLAMERRANGDTKTDNWNNPSQPLTPFTPEELGLPSFKHLQTWRNYFLPAGELEANALEYWNRTQAEPDPAARLKVPLFPVDAEGNSPKQNSVIREMVRSSGNPIDEANRVTRMGSTGFQGAFFQTLFRFKGWGVNMATTFNSWLDRDMRDKPDKDMWNILRFLVVMLMAAFVTILGGEIKAHLRTAISNDEPSTPRLAGVNNVGDMVRVTAANMASGMVPYYGEWVARSMGTSANRPLLDMTESVPVASLLKRAEEAVIKAVQSEDPVLPLLDFIRQSAPYTRMGFGLAERMGIEPFAGEAEARQASRAIRSAAPADMEKTAIGGSIGGRLTPMSGMMRRAVAAAYSGNEEELDKQIENAVAYKMEQGQSEKDARRSVLQSLQARTPGRRVLGKLPTEEEEALIVDRMTDTQAAAYGRSREAFDLISTKVGKEVPFTSKAESAGATTGTRRRPLGRRSSLFRQRRSTTGRRGPGFGASSRRRRSLLAQ